MIILFHWAQNNSREPLRSLPMHAEPVDARAVWVTMVTKHLEFNITEPFHTTTITTKWSALHAEGLDGTPFTLVRERTQTNLEDNIGIQVLQVSIEKSKLSILENHFRGVQFRVR